MCKSATVPYCYDATRSFLAEEGRCFYAVLPYHQTTVGTTDTEEWRFLICLDASVGDVVSSSVSMAMSMAMAMAMVPLVAFVNPRNSAAV